MHTLNPEFTVRVCLSVGVEGECISWWFSTSILVLSPG